MSSQVYDEFYASLNNAVKQFKEFDSSKTINIISHLDADGITACAILVHLLNQMNKKYAITILQQLTNAKIAQLAQTNDIQFIFADLGSGQLSAIANMLPNRKIIILDHHKPEIAEQPSGIVHINPHLQGIDGSKEISSAGVAYLFASTINPKNTELAHLAVIGAIGDVQESNGKFLYLNNEILQTAIKQRKIILKRGLRIFGQTKPLHKALEYSTDPYIPGVTGSESGAIQFLQQIGIDPKNGKNWKKLINLNEEDMKKLVTGIIMRRLDHPNPDDVLGINFILPHEEQESPMYDAREFATMLNACGRMGKASFGIGACLGNKKDKQRAIQVLSEYRKEVVAALNWFEDNKEKMIKGKNFIIINAGNAIKSTLAGTTASIIAKSNGFPDGTYVLALARTADNTTKASLRVTGNPSVDLREIVKKITSLVGGEAGGHANAAGALIQTEMEEKFIAAAQEILPSC